MAAQSPAALRLGQISILSDDDLNLLDRARGVAGLLYDLLTEMPCDTKSVSLRVDYLCESAHVITEALETARRSALDGWDAVRAAGYVPYEVVADLLTEAMQPGVVPESRMHVAGGALERELNGDKLHEMRQLWQRLIQRRHEGAQDDSARPPAAKPAPRKRAKLATMPAPEVA